MYAARLFLTFLFIVVSLAAARTSIAAEDTSPPSATSHEVNVVRQVAIALTAGSDAIKELRGPPIENSNLDRLNLPTPGMDCGIARSVIYVACHSAFSLNKNEAEALFARIMDEVQTALPSESWTSVEAVPHADLIRIRSYYHLKSGAKIDIGLEGDRSGKAQALYGIRVYGWMRF
jgi:hypothetical protein